MRLVLIPMIASLLLAGLACDSSTPPEAPEAEAPAAEAPAAPAPAAKDVAAARKLADRQKEVLDTWTWPVGKGEPRDAVKDNTACLAQSEKEFPGEGGMARLGAYGKCMFAFGWTNKLSKN